LRGADLEEVGMSALESAARTSIVGKKPLPKGWIKKESRSKKGV
jgi:hypothetical protein